MYCTSCDFSKELKGKKIVYKYKASGLNNFTLDGVIEFRCPNCGEEYVDIPAIESLHALMTNVLLTKKGLLNGNEIRFLRTGIGYNGAYFAKVLKIDPTTLSRIEASKQKASPSLDMHIREAVFGRSPDRNYDLHDAILNKPTVAKAITLKVGAKSWRPVVEISPLVT